ncbi:MAG: kinase [Deltaproteobacteria bacterium]|jgi:hypothetical protein|nr:kinase [Deltaproteobacteria bacterium]
MARVVSLTATDGQKVEYVDDGVPMSGNMKDVYWSPDRSSVVAFFRDLPDSNASERLERLVGDWRRNIFEREGGERYRELFRWPERIVEHGGRTGLVFPAYDRKFYFSGGPWDGVEKRADWFSMPRNFSVNIPAESRGTLRDHVLTCMMLCRAVGRLHAAGLALADLSAFRLLVDPPTGSACVLGTDQVVVPGLFPPEVLGSLACMAPEVVAASYLPFGFSGRSLPSVETNLHSLAVLVYGLLLHRHPLEGSAVWSLDSDEQESLMMGKKALFIEHPDDPANRLRPDAGREDCLVREDFVPWKDTGKVPFSVLGPHLGGLFLDAFVKGLHDPRLRPAAGDWEDALARTMDLMVPCPGADCPAGWVVVTDPSRMPVCPLCGTPWGYPSLPYLDLQFSRDGVKSFPDGGRLVGYEGRAVRPWHADRDIPPERDVLPGRRAPSDRDVTADSGIPSDHDIPANRGVHAGGPAASGPGTVAEFLFREGKWFLVNRGLDSLEDLASGKRLPLDVGIALSHGQELVLSRAAGGRTVVVGLASFPEG